MNPLERRMKSALDSRAEKGVLRELPAGHSLADFSSNDYLGLSVRLAGFQPAEGQEQAGATGSRLISGNSSLAEELENELAGFHRAATATLFTSGYTANLGLLASVPQRGDTILYDQLIHASLRDGIRLSHARSYSFRHNDTAHLKARLEKASGQIFIVVESLYSMDGDEAPLEELADLAYACGAALIVDEAHATGVFGPSGEGLVVESGLTEAVWCRIHTFGKALGTHGAVVVGSGVLKPFLVNFARSFIYTTALPPAQLSLIRKGYGLLAEKEDREELKERIRLFLAEVSGKVRSRLIPARGPIQSLVVGGSRRTKLLERKLREEGFDLKAILHPTVAEGTERIRIAIHAYNTTEEIRKLVACLDQHFPIPSSFAGSDRLSSGSAS